ncbi:aldehyde oxidase and xanthine dehydrogenase [Tritrichomonas foetus]|uniref:Aldehyde oxidase and xanthine dehydrogenase n=1 Tax=Tritrichomonas foetus TaxID=1144522 RepID=A0A1J4JP60_9EUKA|nr:aldehyde oxidase and xanthine dehydrogenase [Tritrichomonas foetus]|eukprot:OHT00827.1 aldehyde oxidase and xanthine dehydrogenase [Tritrichomonas foetus]
MVRISAHRNGENAGVVLVFDGDIEDLLKAATESLGIKATRAFLKSGAEIKDTKYIEKDDIIYFSTGNNFIPPADLSEIASSVVSTLEMPARLNLIFYVNGKRYEISNADPELSLLEWLRLHGYTSVKKPCGEGGCGGCAVAVARYDKALGRVRHFAVNSCLVPLPFIDSCSVTTAEGVGTIDHLHRIQKDLAEFHGTQCGFCSPGIVTTLYALFADNPERTVAEIDECLSTNLCRCTGYRPIFDAAKRYAIDFKEETLGTITREKDIEDTHGSVVSTKDNPLVTPEFPEELLHLREEPLLINGPKNSWFKPISLSQLSAVRSKDGKQAVLVTGSTDLSFRQQYNPKLYQPLLVQTIDIVELRKIEVKDDYVVFGAATSINDFGSFWSKCPKEGQKELGIGFQNITKHFANYNIRNIASIGGSLASGDALSDLCPLFIGTGTKCVLVSQDGERTVPAYDVIVNKCIQPNEILVQVIVPFQQPNDFIKTWKVAKRREDSQSTVTACFNVRVDGKKCEKATIVIGSVAPKAFIAKDAEEFLIGKEINFNIFQEFLDKVMNKLEVSNRVGSHELRKDIVRGLCYKFFVLLLEKIGEPIAEEYKSCPIPFQRKERSSKQRYEKRPNKVLGKQNMHISAYGHTTGEAKFVADINVPDGCLYCAPVCSTRANARIVSTDATEALKLPGVIDFITHKDIPAEKKIASIPPNDEDVLAIERTHFYGQIIGLIVAENERLAQFATHLVKVEYDDEQEPIVTIQQAIQNAEKQKNDDSCYLIKHMGMHKGDVSNTQCHTVVSGKSYINNQEHFYLETNSMLVSPYGTEGYRIYIACQNPGLCQNSVASVLGIKRNLVQCETMRLGGGFGGKQDRPQLYACQAAIASNKLKRPIKYVLTRQQDLTTSGMRHEYLTDYKIGCDEKGNINLLDVFYHSNGGWSLDLSGLVMDRTIYSASGGYYIPNMNVDASIYKTNKLSCTAFRGFGVPQSLLTIETAIAHIAHQLGVRPETIKERNLYHKGDKTLTGYVLPDDNTRRCWFACKESCEWDKRVAEVEDFNKKNVYKKRGIAMVPVVSTMGFESEFMMKSHALVQIYGDGSVSIAHGGIEMGQGLHTKMQMIAAETLGIDPKYVKVLPTATDKTVNMPPTAGSTGTDLHGRSVFYACKELNENLKPVREAHPDWSWEQICSYSFFNKVCMQASGWNKMPNHVYDHKTHEGRESYYLIWSVGFSMVELDVLTGEHYVVRTDLVHDCGSSLNPGIDIGQIEGGFVQGQGLYTIEDMIWARDGHIRTRNVTTYKIPTLDDIPDDFRVELLRNDYNDMGIYGSKASGEAGLRLGCSVLMALRDAVTAARHQFGVDEWFEFNSPATIEQIRSKIPVEFLNPSKSELLK